MVAATCAWLMLGAGGVQAIIFIALLMLVCHEGWYRALALPAVIVSICSLFTKSEIVEKTERIIYRISSLLLLAVPHLQFALLLALDWMTKGQISEFFGITMGHGLFLCAFAAPFLLWCISLVMHVHPLSLEVLFTYIFEPELFMNDNTPASSQPTVPLPADVTGLSPLHPELRAVVAELLYYGRADVSVENAYIKRQQIIGIILVVMVLVLFSLAIQAYVYYIHASVMLAVLGFVCGVFSLSLLRIPSAWRKKLSKAEYAFTATKVFIAEGDQIRTLEIDDTLNIMHKSITDSVGNIYLSKAGKFEAGLKKIFKGMESSDMSNALKRLLPNKELPIRN